MFKSNCSNPENVCPIDAQKRDFVLKAPHPKNTPSINAPETRTMGEKFFESEPGAKCQIENHIAGHAKPNSLLLGNSLG